MNKRDLALGLLAGVAGVSLAATASPAMGEGDALAAIMTWLDAVHSGDPATVEAVLAPEFQLQRSDGSGHDRVSYLTNLPKQSSKPQVSDIAFSSNGDIIAARYILRLEQTINGKPAQVMAPRLSVFRRGGPGWLIVAHANFAQIG
ncbi:nuclear transport factor 2 family protein [Aestuariivirga sp.]|jgi:ketosteroid isomerase-like protein|uniref:nuclear transport factor 2 family protein n=1 Tax=Aestuariivirga sp. TaxID=2650926 RepID=UPI003785296A